ncbi:gluconate 2-dehydrogenase subunit 3 family protein [Marinilongibacter aquaticus]|uniref:gluconate 2-dehydrogenase subunit 3 family protein n=1 Tax=Marinilongibacter aquaticus TaxID=2975157 RepID=UPI0021BDCC4D|nr:gluconate 2-dehydrogenase subunit 3 family protein [Marinilongibacter aquaticus]UBM57396.1 gluconate 2-dehydrogenase subunit 3 family protein [Marinilongibacter aquaticus]
MNRRDMIRQMGLGYGAIVAMPVWANGWNQSTLPKNGFLDKESLKSLTAIADTFIPEGKKEPGAVSLQVDQFLDRLFANCYETAEQEKIKSGLEALNLQARRSFGQDFEKCTQTQREGLLSALGTSGSGADKWFYDTLRRETIRGYTTSEYVMVNHYDYVMAPGFYEGCVDVEN